MELMDNALSSTLLILANQNLKMSRLWHFCTIVLQFHQYVHICSASSSSFSSSFTADLFENWRREYGKTYSSKQEKQYRLRVLEDNYDYITQHNNKANSTYTLSLNAFADLTHHEFKAKHLLGRHLSSSVNDLDSSALLEAVAAAKPVSVGICGSDRPFQFYSRGIFTGPWCDTLDHAVLIVGYDSRNGIEYWNVKNSWGTSWGINGYIHLERKNRNSFGINREVIRYPVTESSPSLSLSPSPSPSPNPPSPTFAKCDVFTYCQERETCCCGLAIGKLCIEWNCCPVKSATCCKDRKHCCPPEFPICVDKSIHCRMKSGTTVLANPLRNATLHG